MTEIFIIRRMTLFCGIFVQGQIVAGTHHIVHQRMRVEGPILYELLICKSKLYMD